MSMRHGMDKEQAPSYILENCDDVTEFQRIQFAWGLVHFVWDISKIR